MDEPQNAVVTEETPNFWSQHRFLLLVSATIVVAIILTIISVIVYNVSGSALLDLSRPGYQSVSSQVDRTDPIDDYSAVGPVNVYTVKEFISLYDAQAKKATAVDAFNGDPLNPEVLEFGDPTASVE